MGSTIRRTFVILSTFSLVALVLFLSYSGDEIISESSKPVQIKWLVDNHGFILNTPGCQIPDWDPYDPSVLSFISKVSGPYRCPGRPQFMNARPNGIVALDEHLLSFYYGIHRENLSCTYRPIIRDPGGEKDPTDNKYYFGNPKKLRFGVPLKDEFLVVKCTMQEFPNLTQFIPLVPIKPEVENVKSKIKSSLEDDPLNLIIVGIDSVSKLNFLRHFRKTHRFLKENLSFFELNGYTKVADNTFPNLVPLLTGHFIEHYWNESVRDMFFDDVDFIWKNFSRRGYRTLFAEDAPHIATFNYLKKGFRDPPADYYFRPFALAVEKSLVRRESKANCLQSKFEMDILYNYLKDFVKTMGDKPLFAFTFVARLTHDSLNAAGYADEPTFHLLRDLHDNGALNKSLLILFSDHGIRFGPIRQTYIGKFEERMPFIYLFFPPWFLEKYPELAANLRKNQHRLTTPFDIHATLVHLLNVTRQSSPELNETLSMLTPNGLSLMDPIPVNRTCEQANILPHWCPCQTHKPVPVTEPVVTNCALALIDTINELLKPYENVCAPLKMEKIIDARFGQANDVVLRFVKHQNDVINRHVILGEKINAPGDYLIVISASPSGGIFEGTVRYDVEDGTYRVLDDISRLNVYGNQSICISSARIRKFCFCKTKTLFHKIFRTMRNSTLS
ncbi:uncharacterized protein TNIN_300841 [Trichonephila inaurata madagascariensis]|uniref:Uncharacterized protein n=1 Tax=Trichonephila inaurata madagascariensis TaxID=2747483 RepID=A0A8X6YSD1_9ARAC|nr:uncharacterized protein TNIN_300841 [Trichonephila inaurata madagascariensis]